jgi:RNA polymerase sigma-70 factor (ECF subfamily)
MVIAGAGSTIAETSAALAAEALEKYRPALHLFLLRSLRRHPQEIADLTQEVFVRFLRDRDRGKSIRNPLAYMHGIAAHMIADVIEQEPRQRVTFDSELVSEAAEQLTFDQVDDFSRRQGLRKDIIEALAKLPRAHRTFLLLVEVDGMSCKEAARTTGYAVQTVKQYLSVARAKMLEYLEDYWHKEGRP